MTSVPVIDVTALTSRRETSARLAVARQIDAACRDNGFFVVTGHGIDPGLQEALDSTARRFFALDDEEKSAIAMAEGGIAWRGWFPFGGELTAGVPDSKEGLYFGEELGRGDRRVASGTPLHGPNLFPARPPELPRAVLDWMGSMTLLGHQIIGGVALALGLDDAWFDREMTADPLILFRIFRYPPTDPQPGRWGVAEHSDYGLLTILAQDSSGGLEVRGRDGWIEVPPSPRTFVCNIGDMLDRMTGGRYRSTPHRVRPTADDRLSFPFFFDPAWDANVQPVPLPDAAPPDDAPSRWDSASVHAFEGTYGDYLTAKVSKVFPALAQHAGASMPPRSMGQNPGCDGP